MERGSLRAPPRSLDVTPLNFLLGYLKNIVYQSSVTDRASNRKLKTGKNRYFGRNENRSSTKEKKCITSVLSVFSSIVRDFLELFYNLWRTVLVKNKIVLDPALRLQSFRTPENATIGVRSGVRTHALFREPEILKELHGSPTGGHFGVMKTLHRVRERFCWGKVRADVEQWCKSCDACSARKGPKIRSRGKLHRYNVGAPFERIAFDILGPLPRTASGNKYLLVVMDYFTKWPEVYPIPDQEAPTVAEAVVQHWISRYGVPLQLHSDQGRNFVSAVLKGTNKTGTRKFLSSASVPQRRSRDYRIFTIPDAFGRDLRLPCDLLFGRPPDTPSSPEEYVQNLQARFEDVHNLARERINLRTEKMKTRYDTKATGHQFKEGDKVWFYNPTRRKGLSPKLQSHWDGPYTILKIINDVVIRIRKSTNSKPRVVHYDRLAPYYGHNS
ncbi:retrovirus-related Pol polyprotein from transposon 412 [Trichonephila clavipes]|nr:retrovirus-related Pol polyprotein from transposon 412 [Trichonephila clavipes]